MRLLIQTIMPLPSSTAILCFKMIYKVFGDFCQTVFIADDSLKPRPFRFDFLAFG